MRKAVIIESFDDSSDFFGIMKEINRVVCEDREEIKDMLVENEERNFVVLVRGNWFLTPKDNRLSLSFLSLILLR